MMLCSRHLNVGCFTPEHLPPGRGCFLVSADREEIAWAQALMFPPLSDRESSVIGTRGVLQTALCVWKVFLVLLQIGKWAKVGI